MRKCRRDYIKKRVTMVEECIERNLNKGRFIWFKGITVAPLSYYGVCALGGIKVYEDKYCNIPMENTGSGLTPMVFDPKNVDVKNGVARLTIKHPVWDCVDVYVEIADVNLRNHIKSIIKHMGRMGLLVVSAYQREVETLEEGCIISDDTPTYGVREIYLV